MSLADAFDLHTPFRGCSPVILHRGPTPMPPRNRSRRSWSRRCRREVIRLRSAWPKRVHREFLVRPWSSSDRDWGSHFAEPIFVGPDENGIGELVESFFFVGNGSENAYQIGIVAVDEIRVGIGQGQRCGQRDTNIYSEFCSEFSPWEAVVGEPKD